MGGHVLLVTSPNLWGPAFLAIPAYTDAIFPILTIEMPTPLPGTKRLECSPFRQCFSASALLTFEAR